LQLVKVGFIHIQEAHSRQEYPSCHGAFEARIPKPCLSFRLSGIQIKEMPELQWSASKSCGFSTNKWVYVSFFDTCTQYHLDSIDCQIGFANKLCWICHEDVPRILWCTWTSIIFVQKIPLCH
jgi:hypothetical protein